MIVSEFVFSDMDYLLFLLILATTIMSVAIPLFTTIYDSTKKKPNKLANLTRGGKLLIGIFILSICLESFRFFDQRRTEEKREGKINEQSTSISSLTKEVQKLLLLNQDMKNAITKSNFRYSADSGILIPNTEVNSVIVANKNVGGTQYNNNVGKAGTIVNGNKYSQ